MIKLLLLLSVIIYQATPTQFIVKGTIRCNIRKKFNVTLVLEEFDEFTWDDTIKRKELINKASGVTHNYTIQGTYSEGDGYFDFTYEPIINFYHNCLTNRSDLGYIGKQFDGVPTSTPIASFTYNVVLDDKIFQP
ncbi:unnamed protein product [Caenorhabditis angaria]|uniref:Transthyretin-like family-containing protein n=1 Tax=Caenorhabditis angaria TaxID=860376 RepID=A0A9P1IEE3_9PELO|nr:unnamed protein product [Caenorhabditis angaria]